MTEKKLSGNDMFKMVKEECDRILRKGEKNSNVNRKEKGILFRDSPYSKFVEGGKKWFKTGDDKTQVKYEGEIENGGPEGHGTLTFLIGFYTACNI